LLAVLWTLAMVTLAVGGTLAALRDGARASRNRILLARGRWAAEACLAIASARWEAGRRSDSASIDLGRTTRCAWHTEDPAARLNLNTADRAVLLSLLAVARMPAERAAALVDSVVARRRHAPFASVEELRDLADVPDGVLALLTVDGPGTVNANAAAPQVLAALPGLGNEAVERIVSRRAGGRPLASLDALAVALSPAERAALLAEYAELARLLVFGSAQLAIAATGWVAMDSTVPRATIEVVVVPLPSRLAVIRRRLQ
jgi:DNA uptake protein ComE-like DNA-binding protein